MFRALTATSVRLYTLFQMTRYQVFPCRFSQEILTGTTSVFNFLTTLLPLTIVYHKHSPPQFSVQNIEFLFKSIFIIVFAVYGM